jgi:hypothetical protein
MIDHSSFSIFDKSNPTSLGIVVRISTIDENGVMFIA